MTEGEFHKINVKNEKGQTVEDCPHAGGISACFPPLLIVMNLRNGF